MKEGTRRGRLRVEEERRTERETEVKPSKTREGLRWAACFMCVTLLMMGIFVYGTAFFPRKVPMKGSADGEELLRFRVPPQYDRLALMVIDAFRADFLYDIDLEDVERTSLLAGLSERQREGETEEATRRGGKGQHMKWIREYLLDGGRAVGMVGRAQAPTVTLPRIKALVSGSVPSFLDFVANFDSPELQEDSIIRQLHLAGWRMHFYGDDTWLKLFPPASHTFQQYEGTTSFFVADYTEVDQNVTRCLRREYETASSEGNGVWDALIVHFLGLDHIGHLQGPKSSLLPAKLAEMDQVAEELYTHVTEEDRQRCQGQEGCGTLFVLLGDHGMTEIGNHGGSSKPESSAVLLLASERQRRQTGGRESGDLYEPTLVIDQVDLVPTLSVLLGVPIPLTSLGTVVPRLLSSLPVAARLAAYRRNVEQLMHLVKAYPNFWDAATDSPVTKSAGRIEKLFTATTERHGPCLGGEVACDELEEDFIELLEDFKELFMSLLTNVDLNGMLLGVCLLAVAAAVATVLLLLFLVPNSKIIVTSWIRVKDAVFDGGELLVLLSLFILHLASMFTSSFIEEEHTVWYFFIPTIFSFYLIIGLVRAARATDGPGKPLAIAAGGLLLFTRLLRPWNQTGDKWVHLPDVGDWLHQVGHGSQVLVTPLLGPILLYASVLLPSVALFVVCLGKKEDLVQVLCQAVAMCSVMTYKVLQLVGFAHFEALYPELGALHLWVARVTYLVIFLSALRAATARSFPAAKGFSFVPSRGLTCLLWLSLLLHKPRNQTPVFLLACCALLLRSLLTTMTLFGKGRQRTVVASARAALLCQWLGRAGHFYLGGSNGFASIDISGAYTGLSGYSAVVVGGLSGVILFTGPLMFLAILVEVVFDHRRRLDASVAGLVLVANRCCSALVVSTVMTILRTHLFIWSVFSPRFMFEILACVFDVIQVAVVGSLALLLRHLQS